MNFPVFGILFSQFRIPHSQFRIQKPLFLCIQPKGGVQYPYRQFGVLFVDDAGNSDFGCTDHGNINVFVAKDANMVDATPE